MTEIACHPIDLCRFAGEHALAELSGAPPGLLDDEHFLTTSLRAALTHADATVLHVVSQRFTPQGVTVLALLSESHASIHTYPEYGAVFVDVFTCGTRAKPTAVIDHLATALRARAVRRDVIRRGETDAPGPERAVIA